MPHLWPQPKSVGNDTPIVLKRHLATSLREQGRYPEAIALFEQVIAENQAFEGKESRGLIAAYTGLAATLTLNQRPSEAEQPLRGALRLAQAAYPPAHRNTLNVRLENARWLLASGATEQAKNELEQIQTLRKQQAPPDRSGDALAIATLAAANCRLGDTAAAQQQFSQAFEALAEPGLVTAQRLAQARAWRAECG